MIQYYEVRTIVQYNFPNLPNFSPGGNNRTNCSKHKFKSIKYL